MVFGPAGKGGGELDLYVASAGNGKVLRYDGATGAFRGEFVATGSGGLVHPYGISFGPDGNLYVADGASLGRGPVLRFQGPSGETPGAFIDTFIPSGAGGMRSPVGLIFGPDGNGDGQQDLYITNVEYAASYLTKEKTSSIKRFDGTTGAFIDTFVPEDNHGLDGPGYLVFTETDPTTLVFRGTTDTSRRTAAPAQSSAITPVAEISGSLTSTSVGLVGPGGPAVVAAVSSTSGDHRSRDRPARATVSAPMPTSPYQVVDIALADLRGRPRRRALVKDLARDRMG